MPPAFRFLDFWGFFFQFLLLKLVHFWTKNRKNIYGRFFHSFCATDLNFGTKNNGRMKYSTLKTLIFASYWGSPLVQFSKFNKFLWACWFLCKNLSNFVPLPWKLHNPYCHTSHTTYNESIDLNTNMFCFFFISDCKRCGYTHFRYQVLLSKCKQTT